MNDYFDSSNQKYFESLKKILILFDKKKYTLYDYKDLYFNLHHYAEIIMRAYIIDKDYEKNLDPSNKSKSVNANKLIDIIEDLYGKDFIKIDNEFNFNKSFKSSFKNTSNIRNSISHNYSLPFYKEIGEQDFIDLLDLYVLYFITLSKKDLIYSFNLYNLDIDKKRAYLSNQNNIITDLILYLSSGLKKDIVLPKDAFFHMNLFKYSNYRNYLFKKNFGSISTKCIHCIKTIDINFDSLVNIKSNAKEYFCYICKDIYIIEKKFCLSCCNRGLSESFFFNNNCIDCFFLKNKKDKAFSKSRENKIKRSAATLKENYSIEDEAIYRLKMIRKSKKYYPYYYSSSNNKRIIQDLRKKVNLIENMKPYTILDYQFSTELEFTKKRKLLKYRKNKLLINKYTQDWLSTYSFSNLLSLYLGINEKMLKFVMTKDIVYKINLDNLLQFSLEKFNVDFDHIYNGTKNKGSKEVLRNQIYKDIVLNITCNIKSIQFYK